MKYIYLILFLTTQLLSGQETIADFDVKLKGLMSKRSVFTIVEDDIIALFFDNKKEMKCYLLNEDKSISSELIFERPKKKFKEIIGYRVEGNQYYIYFTNKRRNEFSVLEVNFETKDSSIENIDLKLESKFLDAFSKNGKFYLLCLNGDSIIQLYSFDEKSSFNKKEYPLEDKSLKLSKTLFSQSSIPDVLNLEKIEGDTPNAIEKTSNYNKIYTTDKEVVITLDERKVETKLIVINLKNNISNVKWVQHIDVREDIKQRMSSNSFYHQGKLYQLSATKHNLAFSYYNLETNQRSKVINLNVNDSIWFKNSSIIQKKTNKFDSQRELDKTKQFLRKIASTNVGISIVTINGIDHITIGGVMKFTNRSGYMTGAVLVGGVVGGAIAGLASVYVSPTYYSYGSYTSTKSTFINCLFDENLNHKSGEFKNNTFDKIKEYENTIYDDFKLKTVFKYDDDYIFGYYWNYKYRLKVFKN